MNDDQNGIGSNRPVLFNPQFFGIMNNSKGEIQEKYPEWHHKPFRLTVQEMENPLMVLHNFFETYNLPSLRANFKKCLWAVLQAKKNKGSDYIQFHNNLEKLIEAANILHTSQQPAEKVKSCREEALEQFIGILAHELNTQLSTIESAIEGIETLKDANSGYFRGGAASYFDYVKAVTKETLEILNNMISTVQYSSGKLDLAVERTIFHVGPFINSFSYPFGIYKSIRNQKLEIRIAQLARGQITTDKMKLRQVINNLLHNAFKFSMPSTTVVLDCNYDYDTSTLLIKVTNYGEGIPSEQADLIFEPYHRLNKEKAGTGLGLCISKLYTEFLGGTISVDSKINEQTTFTVSIPDLGQSRS